MSLGKFLKTAVQQIENTPSQEEINRRYKERIEQSNESYIRNETIWEEKRKVLATVENRGPKRWAYEIHALTEAGFYKDNHGIEMSKKVMREDGCVIEGWNDIYENNGMKAIERIINQ